jgi:hypothetical protein
MFKEGMTFEEILGIEVPQERIERVKKLVHFDIGEASDEIQEFLLKQQLQFIFSMQDSLPGSDSQEKMWTP